MTFQEFVALGLVLVVVAVAVAVRLRTSRRCRRDDDGSCHSCAVSSGCSVAPRGSSPRPAERDSARFGGDRKPGFEARGG